MAEAALLALQHVAERLERAVAGPGHGPATAAVVEQRVDRLLQHPLLVVDDDLGRAEVEQALQPVVPVDHTAVEVVQVRRGEAPAIQLHHRAQLRRDHGHGLEDHVLRLVVRVDEGRDDLQALHRTRLLLALGRLDLVLELLALGVEVDLLKQVAHRLGTHAAAEVLAPAERRPEAVLQIAEDGLVVDDVLDLHLLEGLPDLLHPLGGVVEVRLGVGDLALERLTGVLDQLVALGVVELLGVGAKAVCPELILVVELVLGALALEPGDPALDGLVQLLRALLALRRVAVEDLLDLLLELREVLGARLLVDPGDERRREVQDLLELLRSHVDQVADAAWDALEEPDMGDRRGQVDVAHALAAHLGARDLDAAALADDALVPDSLVLAAVALPVFGRTEDALAEEPVLLGLQGAVVDRLRLGDLAVAPAPDLLRGGEPDLDCVEIVDVH